MRAEGHEKVAKQGSSGGGGLPDKAALLRFIADSPDRVSKREIARAFHIRGSDRIELKRLLREMIADGAIEKGAEKALRPTGRLPSVTVVEVTGADAFGDMLVRPLNWRADTPLPKIFLARGRGQGPAPGRGDRALVRLQENEDGVTWSATVIKMLEGAPRQVLGVFHGGEEGGRVVPVARGARAELLIEADEVKGAVDGELVLAELLPRQRHRLHGLKPARIVERHGDVSAPGKISLVAIHEQGLPTQFSPAALAEAGAAKPASPAGREDLRDLPLITIDPADARDHDDAVFAEPDSDPQNPGGWHIIVAIADVAHFVRPGSALDRDARLRGNSAYFPDRVLPMLPEDLSNGLCSLMPGADRAVMAVHIWLDAGGEKRRHRFARAIMRSAANIAYEEVEAAMAGRASDVSDALLVNVLRPLHAAHEALAKARAARMPLEIATDEKKILLNPDGTVADVVVKTPLRAHRVIEDMMIAANVCAAETLEARGVPCMYRIHEEPADDKIESLREFLATLDFRLARAQTVRPALFNKVLARFADTPHARLINEVVLRSQSQARYGPDNRGHFGLALARYAHFTSPIRRYADVLVHRGLIRALGLGADGLGEDEMATMEETGEHISATERRAMAAERDTVDRYMAGWLAGRVGGHFHGRISGVARFGLFVTLEPSGADGLVPVSTMSNDYYVHEEHRHALVGRRSGRVYRLGDEIEVRLVEAVPVSGGLKLELVGESGTGGTGTHRPASPKKGRPPKAGRRRKTVS